MASWQLPGFFPECLNIQCRKFIGAASGTHYTVITFKLKIVPGVLDHFSGQGPYTGIRYRKMQTPVPWIHNRLYGHIKHARHVRLFKPVCFSIIHYSSLPTVINFSISMPLISIIPRARSSLNRCCLSYLLLHMISVKYRLSIPFRNIISLLPAKLLSMFLTNCSGLAPYLLISATFPNLSPPKE